MTYQEWLNTLISPVSHFVNWLITIADSLIHNYFFITFLGITIFLSLFWLLSNLFFDFIDSLNSRYDDYNDKYYNYELLKEVQNDYLDKHYTDEFDYRYKSKVLNGQVLNAYLQQNADLDIDNKRLANKNKIESLKQIEDNLLNDKDSSNDTDLNYIVPPKPQIASFNELKNAELRDFREEIKNEINNDIDRILLDNGYIDYKGHLVNVNTGEIVDFNNLNNSIIISEEEKNRLLQQDFEEYNSIPLYENDFNRESRDTFNEEYKEGVYK